VVRRLSIYLASALLWGAAALAGTPADAPVKPETPLETAKRLAASKEQKDRAQALQWLKTLAKPGAAPGDEALARYGDLCLRFHAEGNKLKRNDLHSRQLIGNINSVRRYFLSSASKA
jgi:hypothetical protein